MISTAIQKDDCWIHSICEMCLGACGILVHRVNGVVVKVEGDPDCPNSRGKICSKGQASLMSLYDSNRLTRPMKRTNKVKGVGVDPGWVPISWEEAMDTMVEKLKSVRQDNPDKLVISRFDNSNMRLVDDFGEAFGTRNMRWTIYFCGDYLHSSMFLTNATFHCDFDAEHCNHLLLFGNQAGFGVGLNPNITAQKVAEARKRGMKVVVVDPICSNAGSKADEWIPIRPGTDGALILSMLHVLLNETGIYDSHFLQKHTNAPYLVGADGYYIREAGKPLVWDRADGKAVPYDSDVTESALEGRYTVGGVEGRPAFEMLREHIKKYTPESVAEITTIPASTIRRMAREFGDAAKIGSTILMEGTEFPLRPAAANIYRGAGAHSHGTAVALALQTLNMVVGAFYVPGGHRGLNLVGPTWEPTAHSDGLMLPPSESVHHGSADYYNFSVKLPPSSMKLSELYPIATSDGITFLEASINPKQFQLEYEPEVLMVCRRNMFLGGVDYKVVAEAMSKYRFIIYFGTHLDESTDYADIVLPDAHFLEKFQLFPNTIVWSVSPQSGYYYWGIRQAIVPPAGEARDWTDVLWDIAERLGFLGSIYTVYNKRLNLKEPYKLDPSKKYTKEEMFERHIKSLFGEDKDLAWFQKNGFYSVKRTLKEQFPLPYVKSRFPLYYENIKKAGRMVGETTQKAGMRWDVSDYNALPEWKPCPAYSHPGNFDLYAITFRVPTHAQHSTSDNVWLNELARLNPYAQKILLNPIAAAKRGIKDGDHVCVESRVSKVLGTAKVTQCIHPETVGIGSHFGGWAKNRPRALISGANFNSLLSHDPEHRDHVSGGFDACARVNVYKD